MLSLSFLQPGIAPEELKNYRIEVGKFVLPWAILLPRLLDVLPQSTEAFPLVMARALSMDIAARPRKRMGAWTIRWPPPPHKAGVTRQPLRHRFGCMDAVMIHHHREPGHLGGSVGVSEPCQEVTKQRSAGGRGHGAGRPW